MGAEQFILEIKWESFIRFDIVAVIERDGEFEIEHLIDAF